MKVIFLDIDGVLNTSDNMRALHLLMAECKVGTSRDQYGHLFDERAVTWLDYIIRRTGADIVISSTWGKMHGLKKMQQLWNDRGLPGNVIDVTPYEVDPNLFDIFPSQGRADRGYEIQQWVEDNSPLKYVILDDDSDMLEHQPFVHCPSKFGIAMEQAMKAVAHLNGEALTEIEKGYLPQAQEK